MAKKIGFNRCPCLRIPEEDVTSLDYRHSGLDYLPSEVFHWERTLEELILDANQIRELPRELFYCHGLRKLSICDNELTAVPAAIASLQHLETLDVSRNGIVDLPDNIKCCKHLFSIEASVNPLGKLPEGFTQLVSLTELYLNDTFLDYLPGSFGRLTKLRILEIRENHLKTLPKSLSRLTCLERLDIGNNEFTQLPEVVGSLVSLLELWCDCNQITEFPASIGNLKQLMFLDGSKNRLEHLPPEIDGCVSLADLHLSTNLLQQLPENIGRLSNLTTLKVDDNRLTSLPFAIGGMVSLSEFNISANDLEAIPHTIGFLRHLRTFYADENFLFSVPPELGSCNGITVLSLRSNNLEGLPDEIGRIPRLRVLNLSDNKIRWLPYSLIRLKELQALWLSENQTKPLIRLQQEIDPDTGQRMLTCYLLPQQQTEDTEEMYSDTNSFHPSLWEEERERRQRIHFEFETIPEEEPGNLQRHPTPYPKEMKFRSQHMQKLALKQLNVKGKEVPAGVTEGTTDIQTGQEEEDPEEDCQQQTDTTDGVPPRDHSLIESHSQGVAAGDDEGGFLHPPPSLRGSQTNIATSESMPPPTQSQGVTAKEGSMAPPRVEGRAAQRRKKNPLSNSQQYLAVHNNKPSSGTDLNANVALPPQHAYTDFSQGMSLSSSSVPNAVHASPQHHQLRIEHPPRSRHPSRHPPKHSSSYRNRGYDSDTGYRSDAGYRSEGCRSDIAAYGPYRPKTSRHEGYSSDVEYVSRHGRSGRRSGYSSDQEVYSQTNPRFRPISAAPAHGTIHEKYTEKPAVKGRAALGGYSNPGYSNAPVSKRSSLRNDELYEQYRSEPVRPIPHIATKPRSNGTRQLSREPSDAASRANQNGLNNKSNTKQEAKQSHQVHENPAYSTPTKNPPLNSTAASPINQQGALPGGSNVTKTPSARRLSLGQDETQSATSSTEDDLYKSQLYQASVKLQKTPSEKRKQRPTLHSRGNSKDDDVFMPPTYQPAPPYTSKDRARAGSHGNLDQDSRDIPDSPPSPFVQRPYHVTAPQNAPLPPPRDMTAHVAPHHNVPPSPRPHDHMARVYESPVPSRTLDSPARNYDSPVPLRTADSPARVYESPAPCRTAEPCDPTKLTARRLPLGQPGVAVLDQSWNSLPQGSPARPPVIFASQNHLNRSHGYAHFAQGLHAGAQLGPNGVITPRSEAGTSSLHINTSHSHINAEGQDTSSPRTPQRPPLPYSCSPSRTADPSPLASRTPLDTPLRLTHYEQDVAVFKQAEPASQVSSSTDSGYVHQFNDAQARHADVLNSSREQSPFSVTSSLAPTPYRSSPFRDSGVMSRESTPGFTTSSGKPSPGASPEKVDTLHVSLRKNPGLGFSIAGGRGSPGNPFRTNDMGIFVTKVQHEGAAASLLRAGDKILEVNGIDFRTIDHSDAVDILRRTDMTVGLLIERI